MVTGFNTVWQTVSLTISSKYILFRASLIFKILHNYELDEIKTPSRSTPFFLVYFPESLVFQCACGFNFIRVWSVKFATQLERAEIVNWIASGIVFALCNHIPLRAAREILRSDAHVTVVLCPAFGPHFAPSRRVLWCQPRDNVCVAVELTIAFDCSTESVNWQGRQVFNLTIWIYLNAFLQCFRLQVTARTPWASNMIRTHNYGNLVSILKNLVISYKVLTNTRDKFLRDYKNIFKKYFEICCSNNNTLIDIL